MRRLKLGIRDKLLVGFIILMVLFVANAIFIYYRIHQSEKHLNNDYIAKENELISLYKFKDMINRMEKYSIQWANVPSTNAPSKIELKRIFVEEVPEKENFINNMLENFTDSAKYTQLDSLKKNFIKLRNFQVKITSALSTRADYDKYDVIIKAKNSVENNIIPLSTEITEQISFYSKLLEQEKDEAKDNIRAAFENITFLLFIVGISIVIIGIVTYSMVANQISTPLRKIRNVIEELSLGKIPKNFYYVARDEIGEMSSAVNKLADGLRKTSEFSQNIGKGNFDANFTPLSKSDQLGNTLIEMRNNLKEANKKDKISIWDNEGQSAIGECIRKNSSTVEELAHSVLKLIIDHLDTTLGNFYILESSNQKGNMKLISSYAWDRKKHHKDIVEYGEGIVGQAWLDKDVITLTDIPKNYIQIKSGLGESSPNSLIVIPLIFNHIVEGIIELASFKAFEEHEIIFLKKTAETIAASISVAKINEQTKQLVMESRLKTERLLSFEQDLNQVQPFQAPSKKDRKIT